LFWSRFKKEVVSPARFKKGESHAYYVPEVLIIQRWKDIIWKNTFMDDFQQT
jgi:hypothetical protein